MPSVLQSDTLFQSTEANSTCLFFFYFFIGCYIGCVVFLIYTLLRLVKYHLKQRQIHALTTEIINRSSLITPTATTVLLKIHNVGDLDSIAMKGELGTFQPLIAQTQDLPPVYTETNHNQSAPPEYKEHF